MRSKWNSVKVAIDAIRPQLSTQDVRKDVDAVFTGIETPLFPKEAKTKIENILKKTSAWALAKNSGKSLVPSGTPMQEYHELITTLRALGIFIVEVGELERFCPSVGGHGPTWVNEVMAKDLQNDPELESARTFVESLLK